MGECPGEVGGADPLVAEVGPDVEQAQVEPLDAGPELEEREESQRGSQKQPGHQPAGAAAPGRGAVAVALGGQRDRDGGTDSRHQPAATPWVLSRELSLSFNESSDALGSPHLASSPLSASELAWRRAVQLGMLTGS